LDQPGHAPCCELEDAVGFIAQLYVSGS
jgi:hypothetical protein